LLRLLELVQGWDGLQVQGQEWDGQAAPVAWRPQVQQRPAQIWAQEEVGPPTQQAVPVQMWLLSSSCR
jgi:hypothetical protein